MKIWKGSDVGGNAPFPPNDFPWDKYKYCLLVVEISITSDSWFHFVIEVVVKGRCVQSLGVAERFLAGPSPEPPTVCVLFAELRKRCGRLKNTATHILNSLLTPVVHWLAHTVLRKFWDAATWPSTSFEKNCEEPLESEWKYLDYTQESNQMNFKKQPEQKKEIDIAMSLDSNQYLIQDIMNS